MKPQGERLEKELKIDALPPAIGYETRAAIAAEYRIRSGSVQSDVYTADSDAGNEQDPELVVAKEAEGSDSPAIALRKKI
jgi:hypothetical protein